MGARVLVEIFTELQNGAPLGATLETYCTRVAPYADLVRLVADRKLRRCAALGRGGDEQASSRLHRQLPAARRDARPGRAIRAVLAQYEAFLPLTIRQIFYRLVGTVGYEKTERA